MKTNKRTNYLLLALVIYLAQIIPLSAQVTIGSGLDPNQGSILDLKEYKPDANNTTSKKGLLLPRVNLTEKNTLVDIDPTNSTRPDTDTHIGLTVYNINKCDLEGAGVYVWMGDQWQKLSPANTLASLTADKLFFDFPSGRDLRTLSPQPLTISWANGMSSTPPIWSITAGDLTDNLSFTNPSGATGNLTASPQSLQLLPPVMTDAELTAKPFLSRDLKILFEYDKADCNKITTIHVRQTNKALLINGSTFIPQKSYTATTNNEQLTVTSNAKWKLTLLPTSNSAVNGISPSAGVTRGEELENGQGSAPFTQSYNVASDGTRSRYNYLIFSDVETPKRFVDVTQSIIQCSIEQEMTMVQWKNVWEEFYGLTAGDEPDSNGDESKNVNKVQWHKDQDGNIFFSSMFGNGRWMTTNLAATKYADNIITKPSLTYTYESSDTDAYIGYPNVHGTTSAYAANKTLYNKRQRLGMLYNWAAATGNQNTTNADQGRINHTPVQGICPKGWHLPTNMEWEDLKTELIMNPTKYSDNTDGTLTAATIKDICEKGSGTRKGKSLDPLAGGFNAMLIGAALNGAITLYNDVSWFWTSSANFANKYSQRLDGASTKLVETSNSKTSMLTVKCKKD